MRSNLAVSGVSGKSVPLATGLDVRLASRSGALDVPTSGLAPGYVQGNLAILPHEYADGLPALLPGQPKPCPLLGVSEPGDPRLPDARRRPRHPHRHPALPRLARRRAGRRAADVNDRVARRPGRASCSAARSPSRRRCSPTGLPLRHVEQRQRNVPMYRTNIRPQPRRAASTGRWSSRCGRSSPPMRSAPSRSPRASRRCTARRCTSASPELIGIADIAKPDYGDAVPVERDELPVFWACGVTPQAVDRGGEAAVLHHARARLHAGHRPEERAACRLGLARDVQQFSRRVSEWAEGT